MIESDKSIQTLISALPKLNDAQLHVVPVISTNCQCNHMGLWSNCFLLFTAETGDTTLSRYQFAVFNRLRFTFHLRIKAVLYETYVMLSRISPVRNNPVVSQSEIATDGITISSPESAITWISLLASLELAFDYLLALLMNGTECSSGIEYEQEWYSMLSPAVSASGCSTSLQREGSFQELGRVFNK